LLGLLEGHQDSPFKLYISPNSQRLVSLGGDAQLWAWNMASGRALMSLPGQLFLEAFYTATPDELLTVDSSQKVQRWSLLQNSILAETVIGNAPITASALSPDGQQVALGLQTGEIYILDSQQLERITSFAAHPAGQPVRQLFYNTFGDRLYSIGQEGLSYAWDTTSWQRSGILEENNTPPLGIGLAADRSLLAIARSTTVSIYDLSTGVLRNSFTIPPLQSIVQMSFSADGAWLAIGGDIDSVTVFDAQTGDLVIALRGHGPNFKALAFSPDRQLMVTGTDGGGVFLWDMSGLVNGTVDGSQQEIQIPRANLTQATGLQLTQLRWSPNGAYIALADRRGPIYIVGIP
jgi:WD40 repeat protein